MTNAVKVILNPIENKLENVGPEVEQTDFQTTTTKEFSHVTEL